MPDREAVIARVAALGVLNAQFDKRAHAAVKKATKKGDLVREPCAACGNPEGRAHHHDYLAPLLVTWLCRRCHAGVHAIITKEVNARVREATAATRRALNVRMRAAFQLVRRELGCHSDHELAERLALPSTYRHWLGLRRLWPSDAMCAVAAASSRDLPDLLVDAVLLEEAKP